MKTISLNYRSDKLHNFLGKVKPYEFTTICSTSFDYPLLQIEEIELEVAWLAKLLYYHARIWDGFGSEYLL